jgi:co-chaperonin GroES (HSP10)
MTPVSVEQGEAALEVLRPTGYRILVRIPPLDDGDKLVVLPPDRRKLEETASCTAVVVAVGETAYQDKDKFPGGPWCEVGDIIILRQYSGTRFKVDGVEHRLINDDTVEAVVGDPRRIERV